MSIVAIVGRPNVGKSTLFNRLGGVRSAIVEETAGVTRDRNYGKCEWNGKTFSIIDTGGYVRNSNDVFEEEIRKQVHLAINEAQIILFIVDVTIGITDLDDAVAAILRKTEKKCFLVVNKVDNNSQLIDANEFYALGLGDYFAISSINGTGTGELLDAIVEDVNDYVPELPEDDLPKFAIVGRPNVGKSSLINAFIGEERNIVTPVSGTTRDSLYTRYSKFGHDFYLIDTAGLRKKGKVHENIEFYSVMRSVRSIESCDVCIIMLNATRGIEAQDMNILQLALRNKKGIVIVVNKWDLIEKETSTSKEFETTIKEKIAPFRDVPIIFTSVTNKQRIYKTIEAAVNVFENRKRKVATHKLNDALLDIIKDTPPPSMKGKYVKVKYISQLPTPTPTFAFFCNLPQYIKDPYKRFLENQIRKNWDFKGVPIQLVFRKK